MARAKTESFITELPLRTTPTQEKKLRARFEAARQVYNAALGESLKRLDLLRERKLYRRALKMPKGKERNETFRQAQEAVGFREYDLMRWGIQFTRSWINNHIHARDVEAIISRAFGAAEMSMYRVRGRPRFRRKGESNTIEGKSDSGVLWRGTGISWNRKTGKLVLPAIIDERDDVIRHGLESKIKYVRLTRRTEHENERYYAQLVCEGKPFRKVKNSPGKGIVGLDLGPSTIAVVSDTDARLLRFCDEIVPYHEEVRRLQRGMRRCERASNPQNFHPDVVTRIPRKGKKPKKVIKKGTPREGPKKWRHSVEYLRLRRRLREKRRREAQYRKCLQNRLVNEIYRMGDTVKTEKLSYKSFQMMFGKSVGFRAPGMFMQRLRDKAKALDLPKPVEFSTRTTKLSQTCHGCGRILKKTLSQRWHECECGVSAQRDLYSAFLARCVEDDKLHVDQAREAWPGVCALLQAAWEKAKSANGSTRKMPASFGLRKHRSQSGSSVETGRNFTKTPDVVVLPLGEGESRVEVLGTLGVRQFEGATRPPPYR